MGREGRRERKEAVITEGETKKKGDRKEVEGMGRK